LFAGWTINGSLTHRWPGNLNIRKRRPRRRPPDERVPPSYVFCRKRLCQRIGPTQPCAQRTRPFQCPQAKSSIRLGFGRYTTIGDLETAAAAIIKAAGEQMP
jgi:cysteine desulfurase